MFGWHPWGGSAQQIASGGYFGLSSVINGQAILVAPHALELLLAVLMREAMRLGAQRLV
jgi:hypothetical protein